MSRKDAALVIPLVIPPHAITGPYQLDDAPDLTGEKDTVRDGVDASWPTSNP
jgi:hypothetical protein